MTRVLLGGFKVSNLSSTYSQPIHILFSTYSQKFWYMWNQCTTYPRKWNFLILWNQWEKAEKFNLCLSLLRESDISISSGKTPNIRGKQKNIKMEDNSALQDSAHLCVLNFSNIDATSVENCSKFFHQIGIFEVLKVTVGISNVHTSINSCL